MKKITLFFLIISVYSSFATHNRSGEILYKRIAPYFSGVGTNTVAIYNYSFTIIKYTDYGPGVADRCVDTLYFGDGTHAVAPRVNGTNSGCSCSGPCGELIISSGPYIVNKNVYTVTHTYANIGNYLVYSQDPNRNGGINNIPNSINQLFYIESLVVVFPGTSPNSSPVLSNYPTDIGSFTTCYYHTPAAYDPDGDSLSYELTPCKGASGQALPGYTLPGPNFSIHPTNGLISWCTPTIQGTYNVAFLVKEWRKLNCYGNYYLLGYVERDMQLIISSSQNQVITFSPVADSCIIAGTAYSTPVAINCANTTTLELLGATATNAALSTTLISTNTPVVFSWNTNCLQARKEVYQCVISANPSGATQQKKYFIMNVKVVTPAPIVTSISNSSNHVVLTWKKSDCNSAIKGYNIYRKNGVNTWSHSACETGVPAYTGFSLVGFNNAGDTIFDDNTYNSVSVNGSTESYFITAVMNDCAESFADSVKTVSFIVGLKENKLSATDMQVYPNPFINSMQIDLRTNNFDQVESTLYSIDGKILLTQINRNCSGTLTLKTDNIKAGIYFLQLKTEKGTLVKKVLKE